MTTPSTPHRDDDDTHERPAHRPGRPGFDEDDRPEAEHPIVEPPKPGHPIVEPHPPTAEPKRD